MEFIVSNWDEILQAALAVFGALAMLARFLPTPKYANFFGKIYDLISKFTPNDRVIVETNKTDKQEH